MTAVDYDIEVDKGSVFEHIFVWKDENGEPVNLTGFTAKLQIRKSKDANTNAVSLTNGSGITITALEGKLAVAITSTQTNAITFDKGYWVLEVTTGSTKYRLANGAVLVNRGQAS